MQRCSPQETVDPALRLHWQPICLPVNSKARTAWFRSRVQARPPLERGCRAPNAAACSRDATALVVTFDRKQNLPHLASGVQRNTLFPAPAAARERVTR